MGKRWDEDDGDARAFVRGADAIEALIEASVEAQVQHAPRRGSVRTRCGAAGQIAPMGIGVTCAKCLGIARRPRRAS